MAGKFFKVYNIQSTTLLFKLFAIIVFVNLLSQTIVSCDDYNERHRRDTVDEVENISKDKTPKKAWLEKKTDVKSNKSLKKYSLPLTTLNESSSFDDSLSSNEPLDESKFNMTYFEGNELNDTSKDDTTINHRYFKSTLITNPKDAMALWIDLDTLPKHQTFVHEVLSDSHRRAASINLPFKFPFYGNIINKTTIATGGFLYMGDYVHSWLAATQYVAPLMANFDTRNSTSSMVRYGYNSTVFVVQWERVNLQENTSLEFTFQCALHINGDIVFVYKDIPIPISDILDSSHPVKIGISDAYFINRHQLFIRRKTIYEYHKVDILTTYDNKTIASNTAFFFKALPTCITLKSCDECLNSKINFDCVWCSQVQRCSDGYDRQRQEWISKHCDMSHVQTVNECAAVTTFNTSIANITEHTVTTSPTPLSTNTTLHPPIINTDHSEKSFDIQHHEKKLSELEYNTHDQRAGAFQSNKTNPHSYGVMTILIFLISIFSGIALWVFYAYRNPTSSSGQFLIQWRPSAWRLNPAETRYTAASIHM